MENEYEVGEYVAINEETYWVLQENGEWWITNGTPFFVVLENGKLWDINNTKVLYSTKDESKFNNELNRIFDADYYDLMDYVSGGETINNYI